ncbi:MAG: DUF5665 domain-containing protein [bacterium]
MDPELKTKLDEIEVTLKDVDDSLNPSHWKLLKEGLWRGVGYLIGVLVAFAILGWILNVIGVIPFLQDFSQTMRDNLQNVRTK